MVRPHRSLAWLLAAGALSLSAEARAQYTTLRSVFGGGFEWTDNANFVPLNPPTAANATDASRVKARPAFTMNLNPSAILSYETPRSLSELQYTFNFATVIGVGNQVNYTNRLEVRTRYDISELTVTNLALRATQGQQTMFPEPAPGQAAPLVVPGTFGFGTLEATEAIARRVSENVAFTQNLAGNVFYPIDATPPRPRVFAANTALALAYNNDPTNYALNLNAQLAAAETLPCDPYATANQCGDNRVCAVATRTCVFVPEVAPPARAAIEARINAPTLGSRFGGNMRHDFKNGFNLELDLGVQMLMRLTDAGGQNWQPAGRVVFRFAEEDVAAGFTFNHGTQLNLDLGGLVLADNADLAFAFPLDRQTRLWMLQLQAAYQRGTLIDGLGNLLPGFQVFGGDVALAYRPQSLLPNMAIALRYQFRYQITEPAANGGTATYDLHTIRNAVGLNVGFEFPERPPAR